jgi:hypothetical protein
MLSLRRRRLRAGQPDESQWDYASPEVANMDEAPQLLASLSRESRGQSPPTADEADEDIFVDAAAMNRFWMRDPRTLLLLRRDEILQEAKDLEGEDSERR